VTSQITPGEKISIRQLAEEYGVSTMPIREALTKLNAEGFVQFNRRSIIVNKLSPTQVIEIFSIRKNLEKLAMEWSFPHIKEHHLPALEQIVQKMDQQITNPIEWRKLNKQFHFMLYSYSNSKLLHDMLYQLWERVEPYMNNYYSSYYLAIAQEEHDKMIDYIRTNKLDSLLALICDHIQVTCDAIVSELSRD